MRHYTGLDKLINSFDQALRSLVPGEPVHNGIILPTMNLHNFVSVMPVMLQV